jgi:hypothetical protein
MNGQSGEKKLNFNRLHSPSQCNKHARKLNNIFSIDAKRMVHENEFKEYSADAEEKDRWISIRAFA